MLAIVVPAGAAGGVTTGKLRQKLRRLLSLTCALRAAQDTVLRRRAAIPSPNLRSTSPRGGGSSPQTCLILEPALLVIWTVVARSAAPQQAGGIATTLRPSQ